MRNPSRSTRYLASLGSAALATLFLLPVALQAQPWTLGPNVTLTTPTDHVGIGTAAPVSPLHVNQDISTSLGAAQTITFSDAVGSIAGIGLNVNATKLVDKGTQIGVWASVAVDGPVQKGTAQGRLGYAQSFFANGIYSGVIGTSSPTQLTSIPARVSVGAGGHFFLNAATPLNLTNGGGTIWTGGMYAEVTGTINTTPNPGAVAAVMGIDNATGTATHWAGYFQGRSFFKNNISVGLPFGSPATQMVDVQGTARLRNMPVGSGKIVVVLPDGTLAVSHTFAKQHEDEIVSLRTRNEDLERRVAALESLIRSFIAQK